MNLTDDQWNLIQPLLPAPSHTPGRPPIDDRLILDAILWKLRTRSPWTALPTGPGCPSYQTCYRRYQAWQHSGLLDRIILTLLHDVRDRGGLDPLDLVARLPPIIYHRTVWSAAISSYAGQSWQLSTALLYPALALARLSRRPHPEY